MSKRKHKSGMSAAEAAAYIKSKLGYKTLAKPPEYWLDLGSPYVNKVFGSKKLGVAYGKMIRISGPTSSGKSTIADWIAGLAQKDGADVAKVDGENSYDPVHVRHQGLDPDKVALFYPEYGEFKYKSKNKYHKIVKDTVEAAEDLFERVEVWMKLRRKQNPDGKLVVIVDSTTSFDPEESLMAGMSEQNMRTKSSAAVFLGNLSKRWVSLAAHTNALVIFISQLRTNIGQMYGEKQYSPGGKGIGYYVAVDVWMQRVKGGKIVEHGKQIGVKGIMANKKNKAGGGSIERKKCGYKMHFYKNRMKFLDASELKKEVTEKEK
jgi:RecA/RadA recombinase